MHGIMTLDKGYVNGETWHGIESYITQETPVTFMQAADVMNYPIEKKQLFREDEFGNHDPAKAWEIVRTDHDYVLVPHVGNQFVVVDNMFMLNFINEHLLAHYSALEIESVGTLFNGATAFVNLKIAEYQIKGDKSPTLSRLMYYNPLGKGSYCACAHDIRIVCNNTLRAAEMQGKANESLAKFRHTASASSKINDHLADLAELNLGLEAHIEKLNHLADVDVDSEFVIKFLDEILPVPEKDGRSKTMAVNKRDAVLHNFNSDQDTEPDTAYALLQATTNWLDHDTTMKNGDDMARRWDGITGQRAKTKDKAFNWLLTNVA